MSIDYAWYGTTTDRCRLAARATGDGDVTLTLSDGRVLTETAATATHDGNVVFDFECTRRLTGIVSHDGQPYRFTMDIKPIPTDRLKVVYWSCGLRRPRVFRAFDLMAAENADLVICLGDFTYPDIWRGGLINGEDCDFTRNYVIRTEGPDIYRPHHRQQMRDTSWAFLHSKTPFWYMWDDHEVIDGYCRSVTRINHFYENTDPVYDDALEQGTTAAHAQALYDVARTVFENETAVCNPRNTDAGVDSDALYFRVRVGTLVEFVVPDCVTYKDIGFSSNGGTYAAAEVRPQYTQSDPAKSLLSGVNDDASIPAQKTWLKTAFTNAENDGVIHKIMAADKPIFDNWMGAGTNGSDGNFDGWCRDYYAEKDELLDHFATLTAFSYIAGDNHQPSVFRDPTHKVLMVNACGLASGLHDLGHSYKDETGWKIWGNAGAAPDAETRTPTYAYGVVEITPEWQDHWMVEARTGRMLWGKHRIYAGGDGTEYRVAKIA